jgi:hypothetical protein
MKTDAEALYHQLGHLVATMPDLNGDDWTTPEGQRWLGRASALVEVSELNNADIVIFNVACNNLGTALHTQNVQAITAILHRALAKAELSAPASSQGAFIAVGESFSAFAAVSKILARARQTVLIVDPYADAEALTKFAVLAPEGVLVRILSDAGSVKPSLKPAAATFTKQYGAVRPLEVRLAPARSLHDRIITVDDMDAWTLTQSLKDFAARSPATIVKVNAETAVLKISAYGAIWQAAAAL